MSPKGFLAKTNTKAANSAAAFIQQYREWLSTGEVAPVTKPILAKLDQGQILPTPALREIQAAVLGHIIAADATKAEKSIEAQNAPAPQKDWVATIYDASGKVMTRINNKEEEEDLIASFDEPARADGWVDRRLLEGAPDWYGEVKHTKTGTKTTIKRDASMSRIFKKNKGPSVHVKGMSTKTLGFGMKVKQTRSSFSRG